MSVTMEFVKGNATNAKLKCECGREFWAPVSPIIKCPDCKRAWNGVLTKPFKVRLQAARDGDFTTIYVGKHSTAAECLSTLFTRALSLFYYSTGIQVQEISYLEFDAVDQEKLAEDCVIFAKKLKVQ